MKTVLLSCAALLVLTSGCASRVDLTNPKHMRERAAHLQGDVASMRRERQEQLDRLNSEYRRTFETLMDQLNQLSLTQLNQSALADSQTTGDALLLEWERNSVKSALHALFARNLEAEMKRVDAVDAAVDDARKNYATAYADAALKLSKLKSIESRLKDLSTPAPLSKDTIAFFRKLAETLRKDFMENKEN